MNINDLKRKAQGWHFREDGGGTTAAMSGVFSDSGYSSVAASEMGAYPTSGIVGNVPTTAITGSVPTSGATWSTGADGRVYGNLQDAAAAMGVPASQVASMGVPEMPGWLGNLQSGAGWAMDRGLPGYAAAPGEQTAGSAANHTGSAYGPAGYLAAGAAGYGVGAAGAGGGGGVTSNYSPNPADPMGAYRGNIANWYNAALTPGNTIDITQMPGYSQYKSGVIDPAMEASMRKGAASGMMASGNEQQALLGVAQQGYAGFMNSYLDRLANASGANAFNPQAAGQLSLANQQFAAQQQQAQQNATMGWIGAGAQFLGSPAGQSLLNLF
jgi:hypothetical protein